MGLVAALSTHLSANLINDYADSQSGADWQDKKFYKFFGGSKLIQEGVLRERFYLKCAVLLAAMSGVCILLLAFLMQSLSILGYYVLILFLGISYTAKPLRLSYRRLGELVIFLLFGPALVMGGFFIQTKIFPTLQGFILSLPFGFLTAAILYANEIPDFLDDRRVAKYTWVGFLGREKGYLLYYFLQAGAFISVIAGFCLGYLTSLSLLCLLLLPLVFKAAAILKNNFADKDALVKSSQLTIALHSLVSIILILDLLL